MKTILVLTSFSLHNTKRVRQKRTKTKTVFSWNQTENDWLLGGPNHYSTELKATKSLTFTELTFAREYSSWHSVQSYSSKLYVMTDMLSNLQRLRKVTWYIWRWQYLLTERCCNAFQINIDFKPQNTQSKMEKYDWTSNRQHQLLRLSQIFYTYFIRPSSKLNSVFTLASILGGNDAHCVIEIWDQKKKLLEFLYNVMQWLVSHDQRAYSTGMLR